MTDALTELANRMGILPSYVDLDGAAHCTGHETQAALLSAMGLEVTGAKAARERLDLLVEEDAAGDHPRWRVVRAGAIPSLDIQQRQDWRLVLEGGSEMEGRGPHSVPMLPLGRHLLTTGGQKTWLLAAPVSLPRPSRSWGITAPLGGLRSPEMGGLGDFADLGQAAMACGTKGAAFFGINPVHAGFPDDERAFSPYSPSHRQWLNTAHIALNSRPAKTGPLIDYPAETRAQRAALRAAFDAAEPSDHFEEFLAEKGDALQRFATHQALSGKYGPYWCDWPKELRSGDTPAVRREAETLKSELRFHSWAQFQAETQLTAVGDRCNAAGMAFGLYLDLAVGTHPFGAETWEAPELFAKGVSLGAPPDAFAPEGQTWNLAPLVPRALEAEGFATLAAILRRQFQFAKLLRIDHILGFDRAFWATGQPGLPGAYVKMPLKAMLAVARIEAARAGATIIGEDLGNIPAGLQSELATSGLLGCRLVVFEHDVPHGGGFKPPQDYDARALASFSTHDLPTWRGWRKGKDITARHKVGQLTDLQKAAALEDRKKDVTAFDTISGDLGIYAFLAESAADLVAVQIEDVLEVEDQPNLPGTIDEYPNWRQRLPVGASDFAGDARLDRIAKTMNSSGRGTTR